MSDTASLYSVTATLIDAPLATLAVDGGQVVSLPEDTFLPIEECWAVVVMSHDRYKADTPLLTRVGFPSSYERSSIPGTNNFKLDVKKRLQTQIPLATLQRDRIVITPVPTNVQELRSLRPPAPRTIGRRSTLMTLMREDMVQVRSRLVMSAVQTLLFCGNDVNLTTVFYPAHVLLKTPAWAVKKSFLGNNSSRSAFASATVKWATCILTSPAPEGGVDLQDDKTSKAERERAILDRLMKGETDEQILARMQPPSAEREALLNRLLAHLTCRGVMWAQAGHMCRPSTLNADPTSRPQFAVMGLFPEAFLDRCKAHCSAGSSVRGKNALRHESKEPSKRESLILTGDSGDDLLEGWHVKVTLEPYKQGSALASAGYMGGMSGGVM